MWRFRFNVLHGCWIQWLHLYKMYNRYWASLVAQYVILTQACLGLLDFILLYLTNTAFLQIGCYGYHASSKFIGHIYLTHYFLIKLFLNIFILYWGIANEQHCDNFRWMVKELSHTSTYIHSHIMGSVDMSLSKFQEMVKDGDAVL